MRKAEETRKISELAKLDKDPIYKKNEVCTRAFRKIHRRSSKERRHDVPNLFRQTKLWWIHYALRNERRTATKFTGSQGKSLRFVEGRGSRTYL